MPDNFVFSDEADDLLRRALEAFAGWAAENWQMAQGEAETLTEPTEAPAVYERGYNDAIRSIQDAVALWMDGFQYA